MTNMGCGGSMLILQSMSTKFRNFQCPHSEETERHAIQIQNTVPVVHDEDKSSFAFRRTNDTTMNNVIEDFDSHCEAEKVIKDEEDDIKGAGFDERESNQLSEEKDGYSEGRVPMDVIDENKLEEEEEDEQEAEAEAEGEGGELYENEPSFKVYCLDDSVEDLSDEDEEAQQADKMNRSNDRESIQSNQISMSKQTKKWKGAGRLKKIFNGKGRKKTNRALI